jgi:hypothetical protein
MSLCDSLIASRARGEDAGASQLKICRGRSELGKANQLYLQNGVCHILEEKIMQDDFAYSRLFLECAWARILLREKNAKSLTRARQPPT